MRKESGAQLSLAAIIEMRWHDLPDETRQRAREQMTKLLHAAAQREPLDERFVGGTSDE